MQLVTPTQTKTSDDATLIQDQSSPSPIPSTPKNAAVATTAIVGFFSGHYHADLSDSNLPESNGDHWDVTMSGPMSSNDSTGAVYIPTGTWQVSFDFLEHFFGAPPFSHSYSGPASTDIHSGAPHIVLTSPR